MSFTGSSYASRTYDVDVDVVVVIVSVNKVDLKI